MSTEVFFPPGPQQSLLLGNAPQFQHSPLQYLLNAARAHGEIVHFRLGPAHAYLVTNPAHAHDVLTERPGVFTDSWTLLRALNSAFGHDLFPPKETARRAACVPPLFRADWLDEQADDMARAADAALAGWTPSEPFDLLPLVRNITRHIVAACIAGGMTAEQLALLEADRTPSRNGRARLPLTGARVANSGWPEWRTAWNPQSDMLIGPDHSSGEGLLARLWAAATGRGLTPQVQAQWRGEALTVFVAGYEAAARAVAAALVLLAQNSAAESTLLDALMTQPASGLTYSEMVVREALRLYPAACILVRQTTRETRLGSYYLPSGSTIYISPYVMHRSARSFADPEAFIPERFCEGYERRMRPHSYLPFGAGQQAQIADAVAVAVAKTTLAALASRFRFRPQTDSISSASPHFAGLRATAAAL